MVSVCLSDPTCSWGTVRSGNKLHVVKVASDSMREINILKNLVGSPKLWVGGLIDGDNIHGTIQM